MFLCSVADTRKLSSAASRQFDVANRLTLTTKKIHLKGSECYTNMEKNCSQSQICYFC